MIHQVRERLRTAYGALSGLTTRGRCFVAAGLATILCAVLLGERDLLRVGVFLLALPLAAVVLVTRTRYRLTCVRSLDPPRVPAGMPAQVVLRVENVSRLPTGVLLIEDELPYRLGGRPRFVLDRVEPRGIREVSYAVCSQARGRFLVGPLSVRLTDPFGLSEVSRCFASTNTLVVTPTVVALPALRLGSDWNGGGEAAARRVASAGEDDAATRKYRQGDDLRKVHWRSTARTGELMVRREEQPRQNHAVLLLDTRASAHQGDGARSSFEWAVSAAASVGVHLARGGYAVRLVTDGPRPAATGGGISAASVLLDELADVDASATASLTPVLAPLRRGAEGLIVAIAGRLDPAEAEQLASLRHGRAVCVALLVDAGAWVAASPRIRAEAAAAYDATRELLSASGWRVLPARPGSALADLWPRAAERAVAATASVAAR